MTYGRSLPAELKRAMEYRGMNARELGRRLGVAKTQVHGWRRGRYLPRHGTVLRIAEALEWDGLVTVSLEVRTRTCVVCEAIIVSTSTGAMARRYCSPECQRTGYARSATEARRAREVVLKRRLTIVHQAIGEFCRRCADGICPDASCELHHVSPFVYPERRQLP